MGFDSNCNENDDDNNKGVIQWMAVNQDLNVVVQIGLDQLKKSMEKEK